MKKSHQVPATLIIALAASVSLVGCSSDEEDAGYNECRDAQGRVMPASYCSSGVSGTHWVHVGGFGGGSSGGSFGG